MPHTEIEGRIGRSGPSCCTLLFESMDKNDPCQYDYDAYDDGDEIIAMDNRAQGAVRGKYDHTHR